VCSVAVPVCCTRQVPVALDEGATGHVECWDASASEILVSGADPCVKHKHRDTVAFRRALVGTDALQAPQTCLRILSCQFGDCGHFPIGLDKLNSTCTNLNNRLQITLGPSHLKEGHASVTGTPLQVAAMLGPMAHVLDVSIGNIGVHDHNPFALRPQVTQGLSCISSVVIEHRNSSDELGFIALRVLLYNAGTSCTAGEKSQGAQAAREGHHGVKV